MRRPIGDPGQNRDILGEHLAVIKQQRRHEPRRIDIQIVTVGGPFRFEIDPLDVELKSCFEKGNMIGKATEFGGEEELYRTISVSSELNPLPWLVCVRTGAGQRSQRLPLSVTFMLPFPALLTLSGSRVSSSSVRWRRGGIRDGRRRRRRCTDANAECYRIPPFVRQGIFAGVARRSG